MYVALGVEITCKHALSLILIYGAIVGQIVGEEDVLVIFLPLFDRSAKAFIFHSSQLEIQCISNSS